MTVGAVAGEHVRCGHCGATNRAGDRFCWSCGAALPSASDHIPSSTPEWRNGAGGAEALDGTTRYLCAAAHMDPAFARSAIAEYLVEPARAIPPCPGVDAAAVLRDAIAARRRGKIRDGVLLALVLVSLFTCTTLTLLWFVVGFTVTVALPKGRHQRQTWVTVVVIAALVVIALMMTGLAGGYLYLALLLGQSGVGASLFGALVLAFAVFGVLAVDESIVDQLTRDRFRRNAFRADPRTTSGWERTVRTLGVGAFTRELVRVQATEPPRAGGGDAGLVVHRGWEPFVGSGKLVADQTISLPLERADEHRAPQPFTAAELDAAVRETMEGLRSSASLSPGRRLARLGVHEDVFVPAEQLAHVGGTPLEDVLPDPRRPPVNRVPIGRARALADAPVEAGRYYVCFRVEAWDRDLVTSCFLTTATDQRTLYLEWSHVVLFPLKRRYRAIDGPAEVVSELRAALAAVTLPATLLSRIGNLLHFFRRIPAYHNEIVPERHGAGPSLRELAADDLSHNFFQDADALRYMRLVEQGLFRAISQFLQDRGYSISEVLDQARTRIAGDIINISGGTFANSAIGIGGRIEQTTTAPPQGGSPQPRPVRRTQ